ncbi:MAG: hypothetical protein OEY28_06220 [Nitrospira sp.]|nr:hypothetical protein [Nitrospira sp.]
MTDEKRNYLIQQSLKYGRRFVKCDGLIYEVTSSSPFNSDRTFYSVDEVVPYHISDFVSDPHYYGDCEAAFKTLLALADEKETTSESKCPTCGSDRNERDELTKAEREIEKLRAEKEAVREPLPEVTVPWPTVTRYSGGASHEGISDRVWVRLKDDGSEVEYRPVDSVVKPAPVLLTDEEIQELFTQCASEDDMWKTRAIEAAVLKKNRLR